MRVTIKCKLEVEFDQDVEITKEEYQALIGHDGDEVSERENPNEYAIVDSYIAYDNILDSGRVFTSFGIRKVRGNK